MTERAIAKEIVDAAFRMQTPLGPGLTGIHLSNRLGVGTGPPGSPRGKPAAVNGLQDDHAKSPSRQEAREYIVRDSLEFQGAPLVIFRSRFRKNAGLGEMNWRRLHRPYAKGMVRGRGTTMNE